MQRERFEACFDDGDEDRWPRWCVVEWEHVSPSGARAGRNVETFAGNSIGQRQAEALARQLNQESVLSATGA